MKSASVFLPLAVKSFQDTGNGTIMVELPTRIMDENEQRMFNDLFPNFKEQAMSILDKETLLANILTPEQFQRLQKERPISKSKPIPMPADEPWKGDKK